MDFREPLLGGPYNFGTTSPQVIRRKSDHPILSLISPRPTPTSPRTSDPFAPGQCGTVNQSSGGSEFQVGSAPSSQFFATPFSPASSFLGPNSLRTLCRIPEEPCRVSEQQPSSSQAAAETVEAQGNAPDLEAPSIFEERNGYNDDGNDSNRGVFGEPLTDDAEEAKEDKRHEDNETEDKFSWTSGLAGLLLSVPLLPSLPDVLNPFSRSPEDDDFFPRCSACKNYHGPHGRPVGADCTAPAEEQNGPVTPKRSGGMGDLFYPTTPYRHSLPDLINSSCCDDEHSLYHTVPVTSPDGPPKVVSTSEDAEVPAPFAPVSNPAHLQQQGGKCGKKSLRRCRTAPMLTGWVSSRKLSEGKKNSTAPAKKTASSVVFQATMGLFLYLSLGVVIYTWKRKEFSGIETVGVIDGLYFCIVTMCTIGYGDIIPITPTAKILACALVLVGFGFVDALLSGMVTFVLDRQEHLLLTVMEDGHHEKTKRMIMDAKKGRMRIRLKVALAVGTVLSAMSVGAVVLHYMEELPWIDAVYATCISITTVGYGDVTFQTPGGRLFAAVWLLVSTLGVARAFLYLAEARVHSRHRSLAKRILRRKMTTNDLMAMDLDDDGHISKSEFVVYKLKEMGKIDENDVAEIGKQFEDIDSANAGHITLSQLLEGEG